MTRITLSDDAKATAEWLDRLLDAAATNAIGVPFVQEYVTLEAAEDGKKLGGIHARFAREWVFVELLAVEPDAQGKSVGRKLMREIEDLAAQQEKIGIWLDTYSFQAPGFYERLGYVRCGTIPDYPPGHARHFYAKRLDGQPLDTDKEQK